MHDLLADLMDAAAGRADYADARFVQTRWERLSVRNGHVAELDGDDVEGIGVRVRVGGAWGFAAVRGTERADAEAALVRALAIADAAGGAGPRGSAASAEEAGGRGGASRSGVALAPEPPARGSWANPVERDPFDVPLEEKLSVLFAADTALRTSPSIAMSRASFEALRERRVFASTEGALCEQLITECGGGIAALAVSGDETQIRSYPGSHDGFVARAGYEQLLRLDLPGTAPRIAAEAEALLTAPACPSGRTTLILAGEQLGLQLHESVGHAVELDRVLGREASYAGTSFVRAGDVGSLRFGSEVVNVTADATTPLALGSYRWDDEGVEAQAIPIVRAGTLVGFLSSRETATEIGLPRSGGCMRADGFARQPIVRMTNVNLEPGDAGSLDDLIASTESGVFVESNRSWSIDNRRLHFQFGAEAAWEIVDGERTRLLRNPSYGGVTPEFWGSCDAVCSQDEWDIVSFLNCGKGEPGQVARVSHGSAPARFRNVNVGVA